MAVRGGSLGCTLPSGHAGTVHEDAQETIDGRPARWRCRDLSPPRDVLVSVCLTFDGYVTDETG